MQPPPVFPADLVSDYFLLTFEEAFYLVHGLGFVRTFRDDRQ